MVLAFMRFGDYVWGHNPLSVTIENEMLEYTRIHPRKGEFHYTQGNGCRVIKGKGELVGKNCHEQYQKLYEMFLKGKTELLSVPGFLPLFARFTHLSVIGDATPDLLKYYFEFTETESVMSEGSKNPFHIAKLDETLYDISYEESVSIDRLVNLNPQVRRPDILKEGERIRLC